MKRGLRRVGVLVMGALLATGVNGIPAYADTGGGCATTVNAYVCISVASGTTNPLRADYYIDNPTNEYRGYTFINYWNTSTNATGISQLGTWAPVGGHSPVSTQNKISGYNCARTEVTFYTSADGPLYAAFSPWQCW